MGPPTFACRGVDIARWLLIPHEFSARWWLGPIRAVSDPLNQRWEGHCAHHEAEGKHIQGVDLRSQKDC
jgi:hypothetical protein